MADRKFKRTMLKSEYEKFVRAWKDEQNFQRYLIEKQGAQVIDDGEAFKSDRPRESRPVIVGPNGEKYPLLGRKPTFAMWKLMKEQQAEAAEEVPTPGKVEVTDTEW